MDQEVKAVFAEWEGSGNRESSELGSGVVAFGKLIQYDGNDSVKNNAPKDAREGWPRGLRHNFRILHTVAWRGLYRHCFRQIPLQNGESLSGTTLAFPSCSSDSV